MAEPQRFSSQFLKIQSFPWITVYLLTAVVAMLIYPFLAAGWLDAPFNGDLIGSPLQAVLTSSAQRLALLYLTYFIGLVFLVCGGWVFRRRGSQPLGQALAMLLVSLAVVAGGFFDRHTTHVFDWLWLLALMMAAGATFSLGVQFSKDDPQHHQVSRLCLAGYATGLVYWLIALIGLYVSNQPQVMAQISRAGVVLVGLSAAYMLMRILTWLPLAEPIERDQVRLILYGGLAAAAPLAGWLVASALIPGLSFSPFLLLVLIFFPVSAAVSMRSERLALLNFVASRSLLYGAAALLVVVGYALLVTGLALVFSSYSPTSNPLLTGLAVFVLAILFSPLRQSLQDSIDAIFLRGERTFQDRLQAFNGSAANMNNLSEILKVLRETIEHSLQPSRLHIFLLDELTGNYTARPGSSGQPTSDIHFPAEGSALVRVLQEQKSTLFISRLDRLPPALLHDEARVRLLDAQVFAPLPGQPLLAGWLALGQRLSGERYTSRELSFLVSLAEQAALAVERAQLAVKMENRAREMTALARLSQGINVTISYDDILELIYAQSSQIIPMNDFQLLLVEPETQVLAPAFYLENEERQLERENKTLAAGTSLELEALHQRRPMVTDDYTRECQKRAILPSSPGLYAWMSVPLNSGAETIGLLVAGSRDPAVSYSDEQISLFQSVADQAAGAIVKTRLLNEAERRAHQLTTLNEVTRQLTSTLDLEPLLQRILNNAVEILNCVAGSLLLVDDQTGELVFHVTVGPVANDLSGRRMPSHAGLAGKAVKTRQSVLVNNVSAAPEWSSKTDEQTGFITRSLLVTPLLLKENVIGVIEVINRKDGLPFGKDDDSLLAAFAAQAAIAIENARLYTMTDQALAARVEELSVMQRIDRELNTSLDTSRTMNITLEWAMRQSKASAGLVGILQEKGLQVMASQGYSDELSTFADGLIPVEKLNLQAVIENREPQIVLWAADETRGLLREAFSQTSLAIQREDQVIGVLLLESASPERIPEEVISFLVRLTDHASIAISNAQLYAQVQAANLAKSEFVSFVAHELKNPMTSVKGFSELLSSGVVGPVNEAQANFLRTIRSNTDRMNTLVSDLNDLTKIEVGRLSLDFRSLALADAVEEVTRSTRRQIEEKEQVLNIQPLSELPNVWSDRTRLVQVLVNLISNANKYTEKGGQVYLGAEVCENQWDIQGARQVVHVWVRDSGIGINEADQKKIFQKFFRSDDPKTREANGTGLGLNITRSLVEMQGGRIWFESVFRKGTTFHFTIPIAE